jgi:DNA-binding NtrC family response regulator
MACRVLSVGGDALYDRIREMLPAEGFDVRRVGAPPELRRLLRRLRPDVVVLDSASAATDLADLLSEALREEPDAPVVLILGSEQVASFADLAGFHARQVYPRPIALSELTPAILGVRATRRVRRRHRSLTLQHLREQPDPFACESAGIRSLEEQARRAALTNAPVLVLGETGTGKGVLARWIHRNGPRTPENFVALNCAGLSRELLESELFGHLKGAFTGAVAAKVGLIELADGGTLFLDELADMDPAVQPKLLTVLEEGWLRRLGDVTEREVDVRLITASSRDLRDLVEEGTFRAELYYRISTLVLRCPPLRERSEDLPALVESLLGRLGREIGRTAEISSAALKALQAYSWPGNIRELRNVLERALLASHEEMIRPEALQLQARPSPTTSSIPLGLAGPTLAEVEQQVIEHALSEERGRVEAAARRLGIPRSTLYQRIKAFGIHLATYRAAPDPRQPR